MIEWLISLFFIAGALLFMGIVGFALIKLLFFMWGKMKNYLLHGFKFN